VSNIHRKTKQILKTQDEIELQDGPDRAVQNHKETKKNPLGGSAAAAKEKGKSEVKKLKRPIGKLKAGNYTLNQLAGLEEKSGGQLHSKQYRWSKFKKQVGEKKESKKTL